MARVILVRHAISKANIEGTKRYGEASEEIALANRSAPLAAEGIKQIPDLRLRLGRLVSTPLADIEVSATEFERTKETARRVGFQNIRINPLLNESDEALPMRILREKLRAGWLPEDTLRRAEIFLNNPDQQSTFNFAHGLSIASCVYVAGIRPENGDMKELVPHTTEEVVIEL